MEKSKAAVSEEKKGGRRKTSKGLFSYPYYLLFMAVCNLMRLYFGIRVNKSRAFREQKKNGAMLVLSNHVSSLDFAYFTPPFWGRKISYVVAENMMYSTPLFAKVIKGYHAITKKQFYADFTCIKNIRKYLDAGISVVLCPEGKVSAEGKTGPVAVSVAKLVKWLGYPVASSVIKGGGLLRPKWAYTSRKGGAQCDMDIMMTAEEVAAKSIPEIMEVINSALAHNEHVWQRENGVKVRGKRYAEGLERLLYKCPSCGAEFTMRTKGDTIYCAHCGAAAKYSGTGEILPYGRDAGAYPARIDLWYDEEKRDMEKRVREEGFSLTSPVHLFLENADRNGYRYAASGTLTLDKDSLTFVCSTKTRPKNAVSKYKISAMDYDLASADGEREPVEEELRLIKFPVRNFVTVANIPGDSLDLYDEKHTYRMMFAKEKASTQFVLAIEAMNGLKTAAKV